VQREVRRDLWILLANLPVAAICAVAGFALVMDPSIRVTITNDSTSPVDRFEMISGDEHHDFGAIARGGSIKRSFAPSGGILRCKITQGAVTREIRLREHFDEDESDHLMGLHVTDRNRGFSLRRMGKWAVFKDLSKGPVKPIIPRPKQKESLG
jgi:hypothetical protein